MLDLGGMPTASSDQSLIRTVNASKNSKLQAVAFDFEVLTKSLDQSRMEQEEIAKKEQEENEIKLGGVPVQPDLDRIQQVASLLDVEFDTTKATTIKTTPKILPKVSSPHQDIRAKYAAKLQGGLAGVELAKSQAEDTLKGGDAAGHLFARNLASKVKVAESSTKWMALTGTGKLLSYLTHRSIRIALLPNSKESDPSKQQRQQEAMEEFKRQLHDVVVDCIVQLDDNDQPSLETKFLQRGVLDELDLHPNRVLVVSDKDDYLKAGKDLGMMTCRLRPKNARRGSITTNYTVPSIPEVQQVIDDMNGISFHAVLNR
jgi:FMN phosphatase YigB (HAD superfamily)